MDTGGEGANVSKWSFLDFQNYQTIFSLEFEKIIKLILLGEFNIVVIKDLRNFAKKTSSR